MFSEPMTLAQFVIFAYKLLNETVGGYVALVFLDISMNLFIFK